MNGWPIAARVCSLLVAALSATACSHDAPVSAPAAPNDQPNIDVPVIDELGYLAELRQSRPDLLATDCYDTLVLRDVYRQAVLAGSETYASIEKARYTAEERASDQAWIESQQRAELLVCSQQSGAGGCKNICNAACAVCPLGDAPASSGATRPAMFVSGYGLCAFVGYAEGAGTGGPLYDPAGVILDFKVFFEFGSDFAEQLSPDAFVEFSKRLAAAGFRGDAEIPSDPSLPGQVRFQYNNIIVHGHSPADAVIAEKIGLAMFGAVLAGHGRGLDVGTPPNASSPLDWHHFLCTGGFDGLPTVGKDFVHYRD